MAFFEEYERRLDDNVILLHRQMVGLAPSPSLVSRAMFFVDLTVNTHCLV